MKRFLTVLFILFAAATLSGWGQAPGARVEGQTTEPGQIDQDLGVQQQQDNKGAALRDRGGFKPEPLPAPTFYGPALESQVSSDRANFTGKTDLHYDFQYNIFHSERGTWDRHEAQFQHSDFFHGSAPRTWGSVFRPYLPGTDTIARESLIYNFHFQARGKALSLVDPLAAQSWSLSMARMPKLFKQKDGTYLAQLPCTGTLGKNPQVMTVILQYSLKPKSKGVGWQISPPTIVSANGLTRKGCKVLPGVY